MTVDDRDGGGGLPAPARRGSILSTVLEWVIGRDPARRGGGPVRRWVMTRVGRGPVRTDCGARCRQCGDWASVSVFRLSARRGRYWCLRCGAVVAVSNRGVLRPVSQLRERPPGPVRPTVATSGADGGAADGEAELKDVLPPAMRRWVQARSRRPVPPARLDKSTIYQLYRSWDTHLGRIGPQAAAELAADGEPAPLPGLPAFPVVVGALHDACYHADLVVGWLLESTGAPPEPAGEPLRERVEHARRWLAAHGRQHCWIHSRLPEEGPAVPERRLVEAAAAALRAGERPDSGPGRAARAALFGTDGGPALPALLRVYPPERMLAGLRAYLGSGARPLREDVLARLSAPLGR